MEGGLSMDAWMRLHRSCHAVTAHGMWRIAWPDGQSVLAQPAITVAMFDLIGAAVSEYVFSDGK